MLEQIGNEPKLPHSKSLGKGSSELRERRFGLRVYYGFYGDRIIALLTGGNKKTQEKDIIIALERLLKFREK